MDVRVHIDGGDRTFTSGDVLSGELHVLCAQAATISKLTVSLIGESTSSLTGASGLLFSRKEEEKHIILREEHQIVPSTQESRMGRPEPIRLAAGCHSFDFRLRVPWIQNCSACPPKSPFGGGDEYDSLRNSSSLRSQLPPSMHDFRKGTEVTYHLDATVTSLRNMFKSRIMKSFPITVWPVDTTAVHDDVNATSNAATTTARATILGPSSLPLPPHLLAKEVQGLAPAELLISATFQPGFRLTSANSPRQITMHLSVTKLKQHPQDMYLQSFQMLLVGYTDIRAGAATHGQMTFWTLQSLSNLGLQVFTGADASGTQHHVDSRLWKSITLDEGVVPDFTTCNLERRYELEILMGWQCQSGEHAGRVFFVQLRTPVRISSGALRGRDSEKRDSVLVKDNMQPSQIPSSEEMRSIQGQFYAPPTYGEAVRAAAYDRLTGFEIKNADGC